MGFVRNTLSFKSQKLDLDLQSRTIMFLCKGCGFKSTRVYPYYLSHDFCYGSVFSVESRKIGGHRLRISKV